MAFDVSTHTIAGRLTERSYNDFKLGLLQDIREVTSRQTDAIMAQTIVLRRIDERLKRNGMSLAKRNRK